MFGLACVDAGVCLPAQQRRRRGSERSLVMGDFLGECSEVSERNEERESMPVSRVSEESSDPSEPARLAASSAVRSMEEA